MVGIEGILLQKDIDTLTGWLESNCLPVNLKKTIVIRVGRKPSTFVYYANGLPINRVVRVNHFRDLGVLVDFSFTFDLHVKQVKLKCYRLINLMFKIFAVRDPLR
jgi:hypothetical protein